MNYKNIGMALALWSAANVNAEETKKSEETIDLGEVVITATRTETKLKKLGQSITVISRTDIENSKATNITDLLRQQPGLDYKSAGTHSNASGIFIRGMNSYHTKLLINGIPVQDPSRTQVSALLVGLTTENVERIEIIRGSASTLYGSDAIGGVINIITRKGGEGEDTKFTLSSEFGSFKHQKYNGTINGVKGPVDYHFGIGWLEDDNFSVKRSERDHDPHRNFNFNGNLGFQLAENLRLSLFGRYNNGWNEFDDGPAEVHAQQYQVGSKLEVTKLFDGLLDSSIMLSRGDSKRSFFLAPSMWGPGGSTGYSGITDNVELQNTLNFNKAHRLTFGYNRTSQEVDITETGGITTVDDRFHTDALFAQHQWEVSEQLSLNGGVRYNNHSVFGDKTTYTLGASYVIPATNTRLKASFGTGYRSPSINELFGQFGPNPNLKPETSESWDFGFEQKVSDSVDVGATYFNNRVSNYIGWTGVWPTAGYQQVSGIKIEGVESFINIQATDQLSINANYTYQHANNMESEAKLYYRPSHKIGMNINYLCLNDKLNLNLNGTFVDRRTTDTAGQDELHAYTLLNFAANYKINESVNIYGRIENLLNENYQLSKDYLTKGRTFYVGLKYNF